MPSSAAIPFKTLFRGKWSPIWGKVFTCFWWIKTKRKVWHSRIYRKQRTLESRVREGRDNSGGTIEAVPFIHHLCPLKLILIITSSLVLPQFNFLPLKLGSKWPVSAKRRHQKILLHVLQRWELAVGQSVSLSFSLTLKAGQCWWGFAFVRVWWREHGIVHNLLLFSPLIISSLWEPLVLAFFSAYPSVPLIYVYFMNVILLRTVSLFINHQNSLLSNG